MSLNITLIMASDLYEPMHTNNPFMPMSLPLLAAAAPEHNYTIIDLLAGEKIDYEKQTDLVGISLRFSSESRAFQIAEEYKKRGIPVVLGGPQVSATPYNAIKHADSVVVGEGDKLWPIVCRDLEAGELKKYYVCSPKPFDSRGDSFYQIDEYDDLQNVKIPRRDLVKQKYAFDTVFATRGCPIGCDFCYVPEMFGKKFRHRPIKDVVAEIDTFKNYYYLLDDTVLGKPSTYDYYLELYTEIAKLKKKRYFTGQANLDAAADPKGREVLRAAQKAGFLYAAVGIESINPKVLAQNNAIKKSGATKSENVIDQLKENVRFIQDLGIIISGWFVVGYEDDTIDTYYKTFDFCKELNILPAIFPPHALPGTGLYERAIKEGKLVQQQYTDYAHPTITDDDIEKALKYILKNGFSLKTNINRIRYFWNKFKDDKIHKSIFLAILQKNMRAGVDFVAEKKNRESQ